MKLAFYYHISAQYSQPQLIRMPGYLGVFVDALATCVETLYLVMHEEETQNLHYCDYTIQSKNIEFISLGKKTKAWHRTFFPKHILQSALQKIAHCDAMIVRSPTPLAPHFKKYLGQQTAIFYMIVGDYTEGASHLKSDTFRNRVIYQYLKIVDSQFTKTLRGAKVLVNSLALYEKYTAIAGSIYAIKTTTLSVNDFFQKADTCCDKKIKLLFTGRIDPAKGLFELVDALAELNKQTHTFELHIVGWEQVAEKPVEKALIQKAQALQQQDNLFFHGKKTVGPELNAMYRMGDLYVLPSYHEGFPRTIWEAMANSLPVIATKVGGIPNSLKHREDAYLIDPKNVQQIVEAVHELVENKSLRLQLLHNGYELAKQNTLEVQCDKIVNIIQENISLA